MGTLYKIDRLFSTQTKWKNVAFEYWIQKHTTSTHHNLIKKIRKARSDDRNINFCKVSSFLSPTTMPKHEVK